MIIVAGKIIVKPADRAKFIEHSLEAVELARKTKGCVDFAVSADPLEKNRVNIFEMWKTQKALDTFRNEGPGDDLTALILSADVQQYSIKP